MLDATDQLPLAHVAAGTASRAPHKARPRMTFYIDVFSSCNLRCPSCPVSNFRSEPERPVKGLMSPERLRQILEKATRETEVISVALFNWTEPLLHPRLAELIRVVKSFGLTCSLSSNLNILRNVDEILLAGVDWFRISLSGFRQEVYERTHARGDVEQVKTNMLKLAAAKRRTGSPVDIEVFFHRYRGNLRDELLMRAFAEGLGFRFIAVWAQMMPVEKVLTYSDPSHPMVPLTPEDYETIERLALPLDEVLDRTSQRPVNACPLQDDYMTLDVEGNVHLCCAVSSRKSNQLGQFLTTPVEEFQRMKRAHPLCGPCMARGLPLYLEHRLPEFDEIGRRLRPVG